jgi:hypothetical protein
MVRKKFEDGIVLGFAGIMLLFIFGYFLFPQGLSLTGLAGSTSGLVGLTVLAPEINIAIISPENTTYNFGIGDDYNISLNVTADFDAQAWWYSLYDLRHGAYVNQSVIFTPNTTINAVRWDNRLEVYANHTVGTVANANVTFFVVVPNSAPILGDIDDSILVCEDSSLNYYFNATDVDENSLISVDINPKDPFYVEPTIFTDEETLIESYIISDAFSKSDVGTYSELISVSDQQYADTKSVSITVIEVNNPPSFSEIGAQTVFTNGTNTTFYKALDLSDVESGNRTSGNFSFDLTFIDGTQFFDIDDEGVMNFSANESVVGSYNISVCVTDRALSVIPLNISYCGQDGLNQTTCKNFSLAVTTSNRAPTIVSYYPSSVGSIAGTSALYFNASKTDPDGNIPDGYWYVDGTLTEHDVGNSIDEFSYTFGCGVSGTHVVELEITDGNLNDSVIWSFTVVNVECPQAPAGGGGGGGGGSIGARCQVNWVCGDWDVCQNSQTSLDLGIISGVDYRVAKDSCDSQGLLDEICGIQIRDCYDLHSCNSTIGMPNEFQACYYIENPSCFDGVKNCHSEGCELLVDCGGPCRACATCSDNVKNQGESGVDCGGPCPWKCVEVVPFVKKYFMQLILIIFGVLLIFTIIRVRTIIKLKRELVKKPRKSKYDKL